jgi:hypothetical protein
MQRPEAEHNPMTEEPRVYAWTPGKPGYESYPQYANFKVFADGRCVVTVRAPEFRTVGSDFYEMGETVCIQLPPNAAAELRDFFASVDTHPKDGDVKQAPLVSGAVGNAASPNMDREDNHATSNRG